VTQISYGNPLLTVNDRRRWETGIGYCISAAMTCA